MVENVGLEALRELMSKHLDGNLWELRAKAERGDLRDGGGTVGGGSPHLCEKVVEDAAEGARDRQGTHETGDAMTRLNDLKKRFMED